MDVNGAGIANKECVGNFVERRGVFFEEFGLGFGDSSDVVVAGCKKEGDVFWNLADQAGEFTVLFSDIFDREFFFVSGIDADAVNEVSADEDVFEFARDFAFLWCSEFSFAPLQEVVELFVFES